MKYNGPKARRCRRYGSNIYGSVKYDKILQRKPTSPGKAPRAKMGGGGGKRSEYSIQLIEKQKARDMYGLTEKQFRRLYDEASRVPGSTADVFRKLLEQRLDNVVYRAGFAMNRIQARQLVGHGLFTVNGVRVKVPSYRVRAGEVIMVRSQNKSSPLFAAIITAHEKYMPPAWLATDASGMKVEVKALPSADDAEKAVDVRKIVEFYSRN